MFSYLFWPNPGASSYDNPRVMVLLCVGAALILLSFIVRYVRRSMGTQGRKLSKSWSSMFFWSGVVALVLTVSRVEQISYVSMRFWWIVWVASILLFVVVQWRRWRSLHYQVLPQQSVNDPRDKYLPHKKRH